MDIIIGTAGHIDHGKTALVKALTGIDADRLPEEKRRGITIDLGFAELDLGTVKIGFIDVPGHEKFVKNMLAGVGGIDVVALVIAADEGVMPQTREHFEICRLLAVKSGLIILTKSDLVDDELLELAKLDAAELVKNSFLENAPLIAVSAKTGANIEALKSLLAEIAAEIPARKNETVARLPIDRAFSVKGFGAVVTGTLIADEIKTGEELELLPSCRKVRVRGLQTHGKQVETARAGQRTAVNLGGIEATEIERGQLLAPFGKLRPTQIFDAAIEVLATAPKPLKSRQRVRLHIGTAEVLARLQIIETEGEIKQNAGGFAQLRLESPIPAVPGERFIIRSYSPQITIAGGTVLDGLANKHRRKDFAATKNRLAKLHAAQQTDDKPAQLQVFLEIADEFGLRFKDLQARTAWLDAVLKKVVEEVAAKKVLIEADEIFIARKVFEDLAAKTVNEIQAHHRQNPLSRGMLRETLREKVFTCLPPETFKKTLQILVERGAVIAEKDVVRFASYTQNLTPDDKLLLNKLGAIYTAARLEVPTLENALLTAIAGTKAKKEQARRIFQLLIEAGDLVKVSPDFYFKREIILQLIEKVREFAAANTTDNLIDVAVFKELSGVSRKYAIPLLEYLDREKITRRVGEKRLVLEKNQSELFR